VDAHWRFRILRNVFGEERAAKEEKNQAFLYYDQDWIIDTFNLKGIEYGNWLEQDDRYIYLAGFAFAAKDYCDIHDLPYSSFGKGKLVMAFGSRGKSSARAHYEPLNNAINITRHRTRKKFNRTQFMPLSKKEYEEMKYKTSGAGSLGHEYGHFLDFNVGRHDKAIPYNFATNMVRIIRKVRNEDFYKEQTGKPRKKKTKLFYQIMKKLVYQEQNGKLVHTDWFAKLVEKLDESDVMGEYWSSPVEVFARSFEVYLYLKCQKAGVKESFLKKRKYDKVIYPPYDFLITSGTFKLFEKLVEATK
jgi:hypothetical protein